MNISGFNIDNLIMLYIKSINKLTIIQLALCNGIFARGVVIGRTPPIACYLI